MDYEDLFAPCFDLDMPGTATATWSGGSAVVQYMAEPELSADGLVSIQRRVTRVKGLASQLAGLARNSTLTVCGKSYRTVSLPLVDGFGVAEIYLEEV